MKAASRPFKSKYDSGRCPICRFRISEGQVIVKLETPVTWIESKLIPHGRGKFFRNKKISKHVHAKCLEERNDDETE